MKRIVTLFFIILLTRIICSSQITSEEIKQDSIASITSEQLKYANLIFVEHDKLLKENNLLAEQVQNYQIKNDYLLKADSLRREQVINYQQLNDECIIKIEELNKTLKKKDKNILYWQIGGISVSVGLILFLLLK